MSTMMNTNNQQEKSTVGLLLIIGEIISNEQRDEICLDIQRAFQHIDNNKYHEINDLFNNLIHENEFQIDSQYRQMANTENGSLAGFIYLPNFHTLLNILKDFFNICSHVCMIFCGQQIDSNGALILSDSLFTCENFHSLFEDNPSYLVQNLQIILPYISNQWIRLTKNYLQKQLKTVEINDLSNEINEKEKFFGNLFYERLYKVLNKDLINFDIYSKLIPRNSSGTIAFDEPNLYVLYGQQGEASLFGIRGFVVLVNGGFNRFPSYWNLIRGLQNIDACILTHFDYDVFPGLQTIIHRKTISLLNNEQLCKPDIGAIFLNQIQRTKLSSISSLKSTKINSKLLINLNENIDEFFNNIKQLNIDIFDLNKHTISNKTTTTTIEPINLYKKIAFGSLDLYVLHPTTSTSEDEKLLANLQKIPIRNQQSSSSIIPLHHWYSSCSLLVWTPTSKSNKDNLVRILYTGACPQTLVFEALGRVRHLKFLHDSQQQHQTMHANNTKTTSSIKTNVGMKHLPQKPKVSPPIINRVPSSTVQNKTPKLSPRPNNPKPKVTQTTIVKAEKPRSAPMPKKTSPPITGSSSRSVNKEKKTEKPHRSPSKPKPVNKNPQKLKTSNNQKKKVDIQNEPIEEPKIHINHEQNFETVNGHQEELLAENEYQQSLELENQYEQKFEIQNNHHEESINDRQEENLELENNDEQQLETEINEEQRLETEINEEQNLETEINEEQNLETHTEEYDQWNEIEQYSSSHYDNEEQLEEKNDNEMSPDELDENNETSLNIHEDEITRPESVLMMNGHDEPFIESNTSSPIDEIKSQLSPHDPMTMGFIEGDSTTEDPFIEKTNDNDDDDDDMEIIHHDISTLNKHSISSIEDIHPQGLPIENQFHSNKTINKKSNTISNRTNNSNQVTSRQLKPISNLIFHVDVAYIPYHGHEHYVDSEFFRRIRARYYILNAIQINHLTLESLIIGKEQWEKTEHKPVTLVPTFDGEQLRQFFITNKNRLAELNINILPAATRCNVQYDNEGSPGQRLRFNSIENIDEQ